MLPKKLRVPVQSFPRNAKPVFSDGYVAIKSHVNNLTHDRLGVIAGRQVSGSAVQRNKLKRKVFNFLGKQISLNHERSGKDLLIILKAPIIKLTSEEIKDNFRKYERFI